MLRKLLCMSNQSEDDLIAKLVLKGETEADIIEYLRQNQALDEISILRVQRKIKEVRAGLAFRPTHAPTKRIRLYGMVLTAIAIAIIGAFGSSFSGTTRYHPAGIAFWLLIIGVILIIWPDAGNEKL